MFKPLLALLVVVMASSALFAQPTDRKPEKPPRLVLAFYYPWYGTPDGPGGKSDGGKLVHWEGVHAEHHIIASSPSLEYGDAYLKATATWAGTFKSPDEREKRTNLPAVPEKK